MTKRRRVAPPHAPSIPPETKRDPWAWASLAGLLPLLFHSLGAPLGEPVADDFDLIHYALFSPRHSWLQGGGSQTFWRPLAYQGYYGLLGSTFLSQRWIVPTLHVALLAISTLLIYRVARRFVPGPQAACAAAFPLLAESTRALICVPVHFVDVGLIAFSALAVHEAAFGRLATSLAALAAALLCKESAVATALLLPWLPPAEPGRPARRLRFALGAAAVTSVWGLLYLAVRSSQRLELPRGLESNLRDLTVHWPERYAWAATRSLRAVFSLPAASRLDALVFFVLMGLVIVTAARFGSSRKARSRLVNVAPAALAGGLWSAVATAPLMTVWPIWSPERVAFASIGLGVTFGALLGAAHPALLAAFVALRLATFAASPGPPALVSVSAPTSDAFVDFERLVRLQRMMIDTRNTLEAAYPTLPHGARVGQHYMPREALYAFEDDKALQLWYRDTTVRWVPFAAYRRDPGISLATIVEYQPHRVRQMALVEPAAMRALLEANDAVGRAGWSEALADLQRADASQRDPGAVVFRATVASKRALCRLELGDLDGATRDARVGLDLWADNFDSRYALASVALARRSYDEAEAQLDTLLAVFPDDSSAAGLRQTVREARAGQARR